MKSTNPREIISFLLVNCWTLSSSDERPKVAAEAPKTTERKGVYMLLHHKSLYL